MNLLSHPKYQSLTKATWSTFDALQQNVVSSHWRPVFHITPVCGLLNDPNGFCFYQNQYHLFYQWYPFGIAHGMKHWAHVRSTDLVNWSAPTLALTPGAKYDPHGAYSGSACLVTTSDGSAAMHLYFTGNLKFDNGDRDATQCVALLGPNGKVTKNNCNPLISTVPAGYTGHVRDPKVFRCDHQDRDEYRMLLGAQNKDGKGCILVYTSENAFDWRLAGELSVVFPAKQSILGQAIIAGYMWECPDYFILDGHDVLLFSPQGIAPQHVNNKSIDLKSIAPQTITSQDLTFQNQFNAVYCLGAVNWDTLEFHVSLLEEIDHGFDFYAPQTMGNNPKNERILMAWAGCGDPGFPSDIEGWSNTLTFPRILSIKNNRLFQRPISGIRDLYLSSTKSTSNTADSLVINQDSKTLADNLQHRYHHLLQLRDILGQRVKLKLLASDEESLDLILDGNKGVICLDRSQMKTQFAAQWGKHRCVPYSIGNTLDIEVLVDGSIVEIFIDNGRLAFTTRVFPQSETSQIVLKSSGAAQYQCTTHLLKKSVDTAPITATALSQ